MSLTANSEKCHCTRWRLAIVFSLLLSVFVLPLPVSSAAIELQSDTATANAGFFRLSWSLSNNVTEHSVQFELHESIDKEFSNAHVIYRGHDLARVISGKSNGEYYYRIRAVSQNTPVTAWSDATKVTVVHHSIARALAFFVAGAVVFFTLLFYILSRHNKN